jgi:hypothetical protein
MSDSICSTALKQPAVKTGLSVFASSMIFCAIGKYMKIEALPLSSQIKAFSIAAIAQSVIHASIGKNKEISRFSHIFTPIVLVAVAAKASRFKKLLVSISLISIGHILIHKYLIKPIVQTLPNIPIPPEPDVLVFNDPHEFKDLLAGGRRFNKPIIVNGDLYLLPNLRRLPDNLTVTGLLDLSDCSNLESFPPTLKIGTSLILNRCSKITSLPKNNYNGDLDLDGCDALKSLPDGLKVKGFLIVMESIKALPKDLQVGGKLYLCKCPDLEEIPKEIKKIGGLKIEDCPLIISLPEDLEIGTEDLVINDCQNLKHLPKGLKVLGGVEIDSPIETLPDDLSIGRNLKIEGSKTLCELPKNLHVGGDLNLRDSYKIEYLPEDLKVDGSLYLSNTGLRSLPSWITELKEFTGSKERWANRRIDLSKTEIYKNDIDLLQNTYGNNPYITLNLPDLSLFQYKKHGIKESILDSLEYREYRNTLGILNIESHLLKPEDVREAFKKLSKIHHPDKSQGTSEAFIKITEAKDKLSDIFT